MRCRLLRNLFHLQRKHTEGEYFASEASTKAGDKLPQFCATGRTLQSSRGIFLNSCFSGFAKTGCVKDLSVTKMPPVSLAGRASPNATTHRNITMLPGDLNPPNLLRGPDTLQQKERGQEEGKERMEKVKGKERKRKGKRKKERGRGSIKGDFPPPTKGDRRPYA